jgi:hypothetical protein
MWEQEQRDDAITAPPYSATWDDTASDAIIRGIPISIGMDVAPRYESADDEYRTLANTIAA